MGRILQLADPSVSFYTGPGLRAKNTITSQGKPKRRDLFLRKSLLLSTVLLTLNIRFPAQLFHPLDHSCLLLAVSEIFLSAMSDKSNSGLK